MPLLRPYQPETGTRKLRSNVISLTEKKAILTNIKELNAPDHEFKAVIPTERFELLRTDESSFMWALIFASMERKISLEITAKVALYAHSMHPAYLEVRSIDNSEELTQALSEMGGAEI